MDRSSEIEILASTLEDPSRALLRAALVAQKQGRLDAAARVAADQCKKRPALRWVGLLLALTAAELRLGGSVAFSTPRSRFVPAESLQFEERWGSFGCTVFPEGYEVGLEIQQRKIGTVLVVYSSYSAEKPVKEAVEIFRAELERHLGVGVRLAS